ncbi:hypothetical protein TWF281_008606 [Arthrobotrys megalospora]
MMDDVVGLVMVQVVSSLGRSGGVSAASIARPVGASLGLIFGAVVIGWICRRLYGSIKLSGRFNNQGIAWVLQTGVLVVCVVVAGYSGASVLFGAFIAGALVTWWDETRNGAAESREGIETEGTVIYENFFSSPVERILIPFFFASIGFSIPIKSLFRRDIIWRGVVYSILMFAAKLVTGVWILLVDLPFKTSRVLSFRTRNNRKDEGKKPETALEVSKQDAKLPDNGGGNTPSPLGVLTSSSTPNEPSDEWEDITSVPETTIPPSSKTGEQINSPGEKTSGIDTRREIPRPPISVYPALILGLAMISRGEIAFLIASIASANGIFQNPTTTRHVEARAVGTSEGAEGDIFLIVIWAAMLCTILGPLGVGLLVKRVKRLEGLREGAGSHDQGVLGEWSVVTKANGIGSAGK